MRACELSGTRDHFTFDKQRTTQPFLSIIMPNVQKLASLMEQKDISSERSERARVKYDAWFRSLVAFRDGLNSGFGIPADSAFSVSVN